METTSTPLLPYRSMASSRPGFFFWIALAMTATAFLGFTPTFWAPLSQGVPERIAVIAIHATVSFGWMLYLIYQTWLASTGHTARHRDTGMIGIALATMMIIFGGSAAINSAQRAAEAGYSEAGEAFMIVPMTALFLFAVLLIAALVNVHRPAWHKRLMLAATAMLLDAAIARPYIILVLMSGKVPSFQGNVGLAGLPGPPPPVVAVVAPALISLLFIVAGMIHDRRTIGRVHPAYIWACGFAFTIQLLKIPFSETIVWQTTASFFVSLNG